MNIRNKKLKSWEPSSYWDQWETEGNKLLVYIFETFYNIICVIRIHNINKVA